MAVIVERVDACSEVFAAGRGISVDPDNGSLAVYDEEQIVVSTFSNDAWVTARVEGISTVMKAADWPPRARLESDMSGT